MSKETKNLKLHQVTRPEDDSKAFNLETMLNENWEKLDSAVGDLSQPVTTAEGSAIGLRVQNGRLQYKNNESWTELGLEYEDVQNLAARSDGLVTWALPQIVDNTRVDIVLCRATKDITNMNYRSCFSDSSIEKFELGAEATEYSFTELENNNEYGLKVFIKYRVGGKEYFSAGVSTSLTFKLKLSDVEGVKISEDGILSWQLPNNTERSSISIITSTKNIGNYTFDDCEKDNNLEKFNIGKDLSVYRLTNLINNTKYWIKIFVKYRDGSNKIYSKGLTIEFNYSILTPDLEAVACTNEGVTTWKLPQKENAYKSGLIICYAIKDISKFDYNQCKRDAEVTKKRMALAATSYTVDRLEPNKNYWVKIYMVYLINGREYFSNGIWAQFNTKFIVNYYNMGNDYRAITGGWIQNLGTYEGGITTNGGCLQISTQVSPNGGRVDWITDKKINLDKINKLYALVYAPSGSSDEYSAFIFGIADEKQTQYGDLVLKDKAPFGQCTVELDVKNIKGEKHILVGASSHTLSGTHITARVMRIWGES